MFILFYALFAPFSPLIDLYISGLFYSPEQGFYNNLFFLILFEYGEYFGLATGGIASCLFLLSWVVPQWKKWRRGSLTIVLTLVIGAGLITNVVLKGYFGRPRPKQVIEFGGNHLYRPFWNPDFHTQNDPQKSFPSGHAAMGFYFLSFCFVGRRYKSKVLFRTGVVLTLILGGGLFVTRIVQGGHFFSDVLASFVIMWYVARCIEKLTWVVSEQRVLFQAKSYISQGPGEV